MAASIAGVFEENLQKKILESKVLVVGAGGIGCEVLKNLVLSGFGDIEIIDLDTIDVSNLNRQFLFHKEHVGKSKAEVARKSALSFNPNVRIKSYHDSILSTDYGVGFYQRFNVVLNALDNRQARNHVNRMCLTANVPLIESGTAGYNGQIELIKKGLSQCYECKPKPTQKTFPGCTIRNTPSEPIHCIVWAKHLFNQLFGESNADEDVSPDTADPETAAEAGKEALATESNNKGNVERTSTRAWAQANNYDPEKIFNKLFNEDIKYLLSMETLWKTRTPPQPKLWGEFTEACVSENSVEANKSRDQKIWNIEECAKVFATSINFLKDEFIKLAEGDHLVWDKDDKHAMDFVAACANIRSKVFGISQKSRFEVKSMAGNIIPAIATTNAITAGIVVMHTFKVLQELYDQCQSVYIRLRLTGRNKLFDPDKVMIPPNPKCYVCSPKPEIVLKVDTKKMTVKSLRDDVLIKALNMVQPDVIIDGKGVIVISSEEGETEANDNILLKDIQIVDGCILKADDYFQNYELSITVIHKDVERDDAEMFEVVADPGLLKPEQQNLTAQSTSKNNVAERMETDGNNSDSDCCIEDEEIISILSSVVIPKKRKLSDEGPSEKRLKSNNEDDDLILVD
ncbi:SUMO-activating enzyme subunit 2 [Pseudolycoriella hygida]|uniref:SUMO-activating enzyme subunit n=1 Tax=Pseudolycoriella hygida TaxID=35572 RepID=A0A9Q0S2Z9_9DIPT|nr:SUMO-activating enzyme subunit 2 [Pseudolycoriella hygida]